MIYGNREESIYDKVSRHISEYKKELEGWQKELTFAENKLKNGKTENEKNYQLYCQHCEKMIGSLQNIIKQMENFLEECEEKESVVLCQDLVQIKMRGSAS